MEWAFLAALAAAFATSITFLVQSRNDRVAAAKLGGRVESLVKENGDLVRQYGAETVARVDDQHRYEAVIAGLKAELARLEGELDAELDPTAVRGRLAGSGLLGGPAEGTVAADRSTAAAALPPSVSAALGAVRRPDGR